MSKTLSPFRRGDPERRHWAIVSSHHMAFPTGEPIQRLKIHDGTKTFDVVHFSTCTGPSSPDDAGSQREQPKFRNASAQAQ